MDLHTFNLTYGMRVHFLEYNGLGFSLRVSKKTKQYFGKDILVKTEAAWCQVRKFLSGDRHIISGDRHLI